MVYELCTFSFSFFSLLISFFFPSVLLFFQGGQLFSKDGASSNGSTSLCVCADGHYYFWCFFFSLRFWQLTVPWSCLIFFLSLPTFLSLLCLESILLLVLFQLCPLSWIRLPYVPRFSHCIFFFSFWFICALIYLLARFFFFFGTQEATRSLIRLGRGYYVINGE